MHAIRGYNAESIEMFFTSWEEDRHSTRESIICVVILDLSFIFNHCEASEERATDWKQKSAVLLLAMCQRFLERRAEADQGRKQITASVSHHAGYHS